MDFTSWPLQSDAGNVGLQKERRRRRARAACMFVFWTLTLLGPTVGRASAETAVSLTFDDGRQTQYAARAPLSAHGMHGTFYVNSGVVGATTSDWHMTWGQLRDLAADGNEITGHSLTHPHLTQLSSADLQREICQDRTNLLNQGFSPVANFAYPYGEYNSTVSAMVQQCGYSSARRVSGIRSSDCSACPFAETIPPLSPWEIRAPLSIASTTTLETMKGYVTQAEPNGGWVVLVIHSVCNGCDTTALSPAQLSDFLDWLQPRAASGTVVKTVGEVMNPVAPGPDTAAPTTSIACNSSTCSNRWFNAPVSVALTASDSGGSGVAVTCYTTDGSDPVASAGACTNGASSTAPFSVSTTSTVRFRSYDRADNVESVRSQLVQIDRQAPTGVAITSPTNGATLVPGNYVLTATASDAGSGVASVRFYVDGRLTGTDTSAPSPYSTTWSIRKGKDRGSHTLYAEATDAAGNTTRSPNVTVTVS